MNETTGVSPFMCVYGFTPRGPLSILQENWAGESELPPNFGKSAFEYMQELKENLETVAGYVDVHATNAQQRYARYYNLGARDKHFDVGDSVIVLTPDYNFSRTYARWIGPAVIAEVKSPYSYLVDMPHGSRRHFHANKLHPYVARVSYVGVINDSDYEFGHVDTPPNAAEVKFVGQFVGSGWRRPDPEKFSAIRDMQRPITQKQLHSVLGLFGHFRDFMLTMPNSRNP